MRKAVAILLMALFVVTIFVALSCTPKEEAVEEGTAVEETAPAVEETAPAGEETAPDAEEEVPAEAETTEGE